MRRNFFFRYSICFMPGSSAVAPRCAALGAVLRGLSRLECQIGLACAQGTRLSSIGIYLRPNGRISTGRPSSPTTAAHMPTRRIETDDHSSLGHTSSYFICHRCRFTCLFLKYLLFSFILNKSTRSRCTFTMRFGF